MQTTKNHLGNTPNPNIKQISNKYTYYLSVDAMKYIHYKIAQKLIMVLHMSFDKFVLAVESCDLSQADKSIILKYGSEEKGSSLCKCSILLGFFYVKKTREVAF